MIEDILVEHGLVPDIDDNALGAAYEACPPEQRAMIKNGIAFAYAVAREEGEMLAATRETEHVRHETHSAPLDWAFFAVDQRVFALPALFSAMTLALTAKVGTVVVHVGGPVTDPFLVGCDVLAVDQLFIRSPQRIVDVLRASGRGIVVDLAGLDLSCPSCVRPDPSRYGVTVRVADTRFADVYRAVTALTRPQTETYLVYGEPSGDAPVVLHERFLGCWLWDVLTCHTFRHVTHRFS